MSVYNPNDPYANYQPGNAPGPTHPNAMNPYQAVLQRRLRNRRPRMPGISNTMPRQFSIPEQTPPQPAPIPEQQVAPVAAPLLNNPLVALWSLLHQRDPFSWLRTGLDLTPAEKWRMFMSRQAENRGEKSLW